MPTHLAIRRIALAVRNLESAKALLGAVFGTEFVPSTTVRGEEVRVLEGRGAPGQPVIELVQPLDPDGAVARFIRKRGEGIHHLSVVVPDLEAALAEAEAEGGRVVRVRSYYRRPDGSPLTEAFLHPKDVHGVLLHLAEEE